MGACVRHVVLPNMFGSLDDLWALYALVERAIRNMVNLERIGLYGEVDASMRQTYLP